MRNNKLKLLRSYLDRFLKMRFLLFAFLSLFISCSSTQKNFAADRGNDFADIVSISYGVGLGVQVSASSLSFGFGVNATPLGYKNSNWYGSLTRSDRCISDTHATFFFGYKNDQGLHFEEFGICDEYIGDYLFRNKAYKSTDPFKKSQYGRVKISAALIVGGTVEFNFYELFDFIIGFGGYDPLDDDWNAYYEKIIQAEKVKKNSSDSTHSK